MPINYDEFLGTIAYDKIIDVSATSVALCLSALNSLSHYRNWERDKSPLISADWDYIDSLIGLANEELMSSIVGLIFPHVIGTVSAFKMLPCDGSVYNKADYPILYDVLDTEYIVSGTQFRVPDLRDRVIVGTGNSYSLDDFGGVDSVALSTSEMPSHSHQYNSPTFGVDIESVGVPDPTGVGNPPIAFSTSLVGGGNAHENRQPYLALNYAIVAG